MNPIFDASVNMKVKTADDHGDHSQDTTKALIFRILNGKLTTSSGQIESAIYFEVSQIIFV